MTLQVEAVDYYMVTFIIADGNESEFSRFRPLVEQSPTLRTGDLSDLANCFVSFLR